MTEGGVDMLPVAPLDVRLGFVNTDVETIFKEASFNRYAEPLLQELVDFDDVTARHCVRTAEVAYDFGQESGWPEEKTKRLVKAAMLHDVGKTAVPPEIVKKPGKLTDDEYATMQTHVPEGVSLLQSVGAHDEAAIDRYHHALQKRAVPPEFDLDKLPSQDLRDLVVAINVIDKVDAMRYPRDYRREPMTAESIKEIVSEFIPQEVVIKTLAIHHRLYAAYLEKLKDAPTA